MRTLTCVLKFKDGQKVTASVSCQSPQTDAAVHYTGPIDRLPRRYVLCDLTDLEALFINLASELHADLETAISGDYEVYAQ